MKNINQQGFGLVVVLIAIVAVSLIGFAGFRIYDSNPSSTESATTSQGSEISSSKDIDAAAESLNDPSLDNGVDDTQLDEDVSVLL